MLLRFLVLVGTLLHRRRTALIQRRRADFVILLVVHFHVFRVVAVLIFCGAPPAAQQLSLRGALQSKLFLPQSSVAVAGDAILLPPVRLEVPIRARHAPLRLRERVKLPRLASLTRRRPSLVGVRSNRALLALAVGVRKRPRGTLPRT